MSVRRPRGPEPAWSPSKSATVYCPADSLDLASCHPELTATRTPFLSVTVPQAWGSYLSHTLQEHVPHPTHERLLHDAQLLLNKQQQIWDGIYNHLTFPPAHHISSAYFTAPPVPRMFVKNVPSVYVSCRVSNVPENFVHPIFLE